MTHGLSPRGAPSRDALRQCRGDQRARGAPSSAAAAADSHPPSVEKGRLGELQRRSASGPLPRAGRVQSRRAPALY